MTINVITAFSIYGQIPREESSTKSDKEKRVILKKAPASGAGLSYDRKELDNIKVIHNYRSPQVS